MKIIIEYPLSLKNSVKSSFNRHIKTFDLETKKQRIQKFKFIL